MLSPNPRLGMSNLKAIDPNEDFFASSLYIILFFFCFFLLWLFTTDYNVPSFG